MTMNSKVYGNGLSIAKERNNITNKIDQLNVEKFRKLQKDIKSNSNEIQQKYNELCKVASPVVTNDYFWGKIKFTNVEKSLDSLLKLVQDVAKSTLGAFQGNSRNLEAILELMKVSISIENDLYHQLDDCDCSKENIANLLHDLCVQYNIDSKAIESLFEQSFNRTITLRTRINNLRQEISEHLTMFEKNLNTINESIEQKEKELTSIIESRVDEMHKQLDTLVKDYVSEMNTYKTEINKIRDEYYLESESIKSELVDYIKQYNENLAHVHDLRFEQLQKENSELKEQVLSLNTNVSKLNKNTTWSFVFTCIAILIAAIALFI